MFNITEVPTTNIIPDSRTREALKDIKSLTISIEREGLLQPIILGDDYKLIAGRRRYNACKALGWETIPSYIIPGITEDAKLMIEFVENVEREGFTWAEELELKNKLHNYWKDQEPGWGFRETAARMKVSLGGLSTDLTLAAALPHFPALKTETTKAKARDSYKKLQQQAEAMTAIESLPIEEQKNLKRMMKGEPVVSKGKNVQDGANGDAGTTNGKNVGGSTQNLTDPTTALFEGQDTDSLPAFTYQICTFEELLPEIPDNSIGFAELDPPYAIDFNNTYGQTTNIKSKEDDWSVEELRASMRILFDSLYEKLLDNSWVLCWAGKEHWIEMNKLAANAGFGIQPPGIWAKPSGSSNSPSTNMISNYEMFLLFRKGKASFNVDSFKSVQECAPPPASQRTHQWEKPIKLYNTFMSALGKPKTLFFSPFAGSGASMVSASLAGMTPIGCDIRQKYFYSFIKMMKNYHVKGE